MFVNWFWLVLGLLSVPDYAGFSKGKSAKDLRQAAWNKQWGNVPTKMFVQMVQVLAPPSWSDNKQEGLWLELWRCEQKIKAPSCCSHRHEVVKCPFCIASLKFTSDWNIFMWWCSLLPFFSTAYLNLSGPVSLPVLTVSPEMPLSCPKGCDRCSEYNGCIKCKPKLFIFLERNDIRQIGVCLASCPMGYFGMRNPEGNNRCTREFCFQLWPCWAY